LGKWLVGVSFNSPAGFGLSQLRLLVMKSISLASPEGRLFQPHFDIPGKEGTVAQEVIEIVGASKESFAKAAEDASAEAARTIRSSKGGRVAEFEMARIRDGRIRDGA
jgi:flavin-binding protein dodecin